MRRRIRAKEKQEKREDRRPILKRLCATLLQSFRGQHCKKMKGSAWGNWDSRGGQQPFRPNPNGFGDCTTTLRRLLIDAVHFMTRILTRVIVLLTACSTKRLFSTRTDSKYLLLKPIYTFFLLDGICL